MRELVDPDRENFDRDLVDAVEELADRAKQAEHLMASAPVMIDIELVNVIDALRGVAQALEGEVEAVWLHEVPWLQLP
jgi:hypothetical protein